jgi:hypothetical protein
LVDHLLLVHHFQSINSFDVVLLQYHYQNFVDEPVVDVKMFLFQLDQDFVAVVVELHQQYLLDV